MRRSGRRAHTEDPRAAQRFQELGRARDRVGWVSHGRLWTLTDARNGTTVYTYNSADQVLSTTAPTLGTGEPAFVTSQQYDLEGRVVKTVYPDGASMTNVFLANGLLQKTSGSRVYPVEYTYDAQGRMRTMKTWQDFAGNTRTAITRWNYHPQRGWLASKDYPDAATGSPPEQPGTGGPQYTNWPSGRLAQRTWKRGVATQYTYNAAGDLAGVNYSDSTPDASYGYDRQGQRTNVVCNGVTTSVSFNGAGALLTETYSGGTLAGLAMNWNTNSLLNQITGRSVAPYVDVAGVANPTTNVTVSAAGQTFTAARRGDYFHHALNVPNSSAQYPTVEVTSAFTNWTESGQVFVAASPEVFTYDADGNLTSDGRWAYTWNGENRLVEMKRDAVSPSGARIWLVFEYDAQGRRIRKTVSTYAAGGWVEQTDAVFLYDGWNVVAELDANAAKARLRTYVWGIDLSGTLQGAGGVGGLLWVTNYQTAYQEETLPTGVHLVAYDGNGNVMALVKAADGTVSARYEYGPFAEPVRVSGSLGKAQPFRFSTKWTDAESGLVYYGYRYYNPTAGRSLSVDPVAEGGVLNVYILMANRSLDKVDVLGAATYRAHNAVVVVENEKAQLVAYPAKGRLCACRGRPIGIVLLTAWIDATPQNSLELACPDVYRRVSPFVPASYLKAVNAAAYVGAGIFLDFIPHDRVGPICCPRPSWHQERKDWLGIWVDDGTRSGRVHVDFPGGQVQQFPKKRQTQFRLTFRCDDEDIMRWEWSYSITPGVFGSVALPF